MSKIDKEVVFIAKGATGEMTSVQRATRRLIKVYSLRKEAKKELDQLHNSCLAIDGSDLMRASSK